MILKSLQEQIKWEGRILKSLRDAEALFGLLVQWQIPAEDLEDESTDISRRSDNEQGRRYCAKLKNMHNLVWHKYTAITLWDKGKVVRNLLVSLLHSPTLLEAFPALKHQDSVL